MVILGDLEGLLLTGFTFPYASDLLQNYINKTSDIQTVSLLFSHCPLKCFKDSNSRDAGLLAAERRNEWVELYVRRRGDLSLNC